MLPWPVFSRMFQLWTISDVLMINFYASGSISLENVTLVGEKSVFFPLSEPVHCLFARHLDGILPVQHRGFHLPADQKQRGVECLLLIVYSSINT